MTELTVPARPFRAERLLAGVRFYFQKAWIRCLVLGIIGFAVRVPALSGEPLWDDDYLVKTNPFIKSPFLCLEVFRHYLFPESYSSHYRPVQNISYMADYLFWNGNFYGFHVTSVLCHVGAGVCLYLLLQRLIDGLFRRTSSQPNEHQEQSERSGFRLWAPFFVALLWIVHPVHSAAIDYVSGRADPLAVLFGAGAWLLFFRAREIPHRFLRVIAFAGAWGVAFLALCSRESACLWPILFLVYVFSFERPKRTTHTWLIVVVCLVLFGVYYGLRHLPGDRLETGGSSHWSVPLRGVLMLRALGDYGRLMLFPANLHMERTVYSPSAMSNEAQRWNAIGFEYLSLGGLLILAVFAFMCLRRGPGQRTRVFGVAWFLLTYLPISNLIELNATVAEHWLYLPSVGFLIFLAGCAMDLPRQWSRPVAACACLMAVALGARSVVRSSDWVSNETFARQTIRAGGLSIRIALMMGQVFANRQDYAEAEKILRKAVELCPDYPMARNNLAHALVHQGKEKEAEALYAESTKAAPQSRKDYPRTWIAALNLAHMREEKDKAGAIDILEKARRDYPQTWELVSLESELLREDDKFDEALNIVRPFAEENRWHYGAWLALGRVLAQKGDVENAIMALRHASWLDIHDVASLNLMAFVCAGRNQLNDAVRIQRRAVARQPDQPRQYLLLSNILDKMGRTEEARDALAQISRLRSLAGAEKPHDKYLN